MKLHSSGIQGMNLKWKQERSLFLEVRFSLNAFIFTTETATRSFQYDFLFFSPKWQPGQPDNRKPFSVRLSQILKTCIVTK